MKALDIIKQFYSEYDRADEDIVKFLSNEDAKWLAFDEGTNNIFLNVINDKSIKDTDGDWIRILDYSNMILPGVSVDIETSNEKVLITKELREELTYIREMGQL